MVDHVDVQYAFKSKISKIENKTHLVLKEDEGVRREEDFIPSETDFKKMLLFMLNKKFESFYTIREKAEEKEQARLKKVKEREEKKKKSGMVPQKSEQAHDPREDRQHALHQQIRHLISKDGITEDDAVNRFDLVVEANKPPLCILVVGKPRSGKSNVSKSLGEALDLVHVCVKSYINALLHKISTYELPEDLEEGKEPPKFLSDFEEEVFQVLKAGKGPSDAQMVRMLADMIASPQAQTKGYIVDLPLHQREESWHDTISRGALNFLTQDLSFVIDLQMSDVDVRQRASGIRFDPETGEIVSRRERQDRRKPNKKKKSNDEGEGEGEGDNDNNEEEQEPDPDDPDAPKKPKVLDEDKVLIRVKDFDERLNDELNNFNTVERPAFNRLVKNLYHKQYIQIN